MKNAFFRNNDGFTLVELIVVISLTLLFVGASVSYNRTSDKLISIYREQGKIVSKIQQAKSLALSTYLGKEGGIGCGWGVHLDSSKSQIIVFKDIPSQGQGEFERCKNFTGELYSDNDVILESLFLTEAKLDLSQGDGILDILFVPPDPKVYLYPDTEEAVINMFSEKVPNLNLSVRVNKFGQISSD